MRAVAARYWTIESSGAVPESLKLYGHCSFALALLAAPPRPAAALVLAPPPPAMALLMAPPLLALTFAAVLVVALAVAPAVALVVAPPRLPRPPRPPPPPRRPTCVQCSVGAPLTTSQRYFVLAGTVNSAV